MEGSAAEVVANVIKARRPFAIGTELALHQFWNSSFSCRSTPGIFIATLARSFLAAIPHHAIGQTIGQVVVGCEESCRLR